MAAAILSEPRLLGVLYLLVMGIGVVELNRKMGILSCPSSLSASGVMSRTELRMPHLKAYLLAKAGRAARVSLDVRVSSRGSLPLKATSFATVLPMSIISFTAAKVRYFIDMRKPWRKKICT